MGRNLHCNTSRIGKNNFKTLRLVRGKLDRAEYARPSNRHRCAVTEKSLFDIGWNFLVVTDDCHM